MRYGWCSLILLAVGCGRPMVPRMEEVVPAANATIVGPDLAAPQWGPGDWPGWRGPHHAGVATDAAPVEWSDSQNIIWKTKLPGRGRSSPIVLGDRIYLETADEHSQVQAVIAIDRKRGKPIWQTDLHRGNFERDVHPENTQASSTLATDGERLFAVFLNDRRIWCSAIGLEGDELWRQEVGNFRSKQGYSGSPVVYESLVIIAADHSSGGFIAGLNRFNNGEIVWRRNRPAMDSYASPRVVRIGGEDQVVISGCNEIASYNPLTGKSLWTTPGTTESTVGTAVATEELVIVSGGYPESETIALRSDGSIAWKNREKYYVPSLLVYRGHLYGVRDDGIARCYDAATGMKRWEQRIGGDFRASPVAAGDNIYVTDRSGKTTVFKANPEHFERVAENSLTGEVYASAAISSGQIFLRTAEGDRTRRQEYLYCIGETPRTTSRDR